MRTVSVLLFLVAPLVAQKNLMTNGSVDGPAGWLQTGGGKGVSFAIDRDSGAKKKGALRITCEDPGSETAHNWFQRIEPPRKLPARLELSLSGKTTGMLPGASARVIVQRWSADDRMVGFSGTGYLEEDTDWTKLTCVFDVPKDCETILIRGFLVGKGTVWWDDFVLRPTKKPVTKDPERASKDSAYQRLVRRCASEIPWLFDAAEAKRRSRKEKKPILLYVRCTDDEKGLPSAQAGLTAEGVRFADDGHKKDILFRAGPLSDPEVADVVARRFIPLCLTYRLATHGRGQRGHPLEAFKLNAEDVVTPALIAVGRKKLKLHRIGVLADDLVDRWLREALDVLKSPSRAEGPAERLRDGDLRAVLAATDGATKAEMKLLRARALRRAGNLARAEELLAGLEGDEVRHERGLIAMRRGHWSEARARFEKAGDGASRWRSALCLHREGRQAEAQAAWKAMVGDDRWGRRAVACILPSGPRLWLSTSPRQWPETKKIPEHTESGVAAKEFDPVPSIHRLLELQRVDGSFGGHDGETGRGYHDASVTAFASEALLAWCPNLPGPLKERAHAAAQRALGWLEAWTRRANAGGDPFNNPYVLMHLVDQARGPAARALIARIAKNQLPDGNWTVYVPDRPASFNTALNVLALARAKKAGLPVPESVLTQGRKALAAMRQKGGLFPYSTKDGHEWMTTKHGSIARDPLCEAALHAAGHGSKSSTDKALSRFLKFHGELRTPTKKLYDYFNSRGHGGYYFFFAHRNAIEAAALVGAAKRKKVHQAVRREVLEARELDGTFMDQYMLGRAYGTAMALAILARL